MQITIPRHILVDSDAAPKYGTPFAYVCADVDPFFFPPGRQHLLLHGAVGETAN